MLLFPPQALSTLDSLSLMYPFFYRPLFEVREDGWNLFLPEDAFKDLESMVCSQLCLKLILFHNLLPCVAYAYHFAIMFIRQMSGD